MKNVTGVILDMDGLIFDTEAIYSVTNVSTAQELGIVDYDMAYYYTEIGVGEEEAYENYFKDFPDVPKETIATFFKESRLRSMTKFQEEGAPLKKGALELLMYLKEAGIPRVIASSNTKEAIDTLIEKADIAHFFDDIVSGDDVTRAKPDPEIVLKGLEKLGTKAEETLMLEDSLNGIRASHAANVPVIMVPDLIEPTEEALEKSYAVKKDLLEVMTFIKEK